MNDILVVDDEQDIRDLICDILQDEGFITRRAGTADDCMAELQKATPGLVILDIWLKDSHMDGIDILSHIKRNTPNVPVVIISGHGNVEIAVAAIKQGAYDFIEKPFNIDQLMVVIRRAMETSRLRNENLALKQQDAKSPVMIGESSIFKSMKAQLDKITKSNGRVLLTGGAGSGKETAARYIHIKSNRANAPFVTLSAASIHPDRMEHVLFGRESDDTGIEPGLLEQADGGILYLEEVADMPMETQSKILRVLVDQKFTRVGGTQKIQVDCRVMSSTTRDLTHEISQGRFKQELYHRLNVVPVDIPTLEDRREDIPDLARHFIADLNQSQGLPLRDLGEDAIAALQTLSWPGNIRQLRNIIERALILGDDDGPIGASDLPNATQDTPADQDFSLSASIKTLSLREARELFERHYLVVQINRFGGNISRTANFIGMERSALHRKLKSLGIVTTAKSGARQAQIDD
jgi:two-component system nitrogen regulation response regulator NtrX